MALTLASCGESITSKAIKVINDNGAEEFTENDSEGLLGCFGSNSVDTIAKEVVNGNILVDNILYYYNFRNLYSVSIYSSKEAIDISDININLKMLSNAENEYNKNTNYITESQFISIVNDFAKDKSLDIVSLVDTKIEEAKAAEIEEANRKAQQEADELAKQAEIERKEAEERERIESILATEPTSMDISDIIELYNKSDDNYKSLNDKHLSITGYVKNKSTSGPEIYVRVDAQNMKSVFGSKFVFKSDIDISGIEALEDGQKVTINGIGDTSGMTFGMYECTLTNAGTTDFDESDFIKLDVEAARRNPSDWEGKMVYFSGKITQVMPSGLKNMTLHDRYVVDYGGNKVLFFFKSNTRFLEGDNVKVYGTVYSLADVTSLLGVTTTAPDIEAMRVSY